MGATVFTLLVHCEKSGPGEGEDQPDQFLLLAGFQRLGSFTQTNEASIIYTACTQIQVNIRGLLKGGQGTSTTLWYISKTDRSL